MDADIKLDGAQLTLECDVLTSSAYCLMLDRTDRRASPGGYRRAIEHGPGDKLALNYQGDYPGGVVIYGPIRITVHEPSLEAPRVGQAVQMRSVSIELNAEIENLRRRISELEERIALLEK